jgi:hypothetical protein
LGPEVFTGIVIYDDEYDDDALWDELSYPNIHEGRRYGGAVNI